MSERVMLAGAPVVGFGQVEAVAPVAVAAVTPWRVALTTSVVGAFTGWAIEEVSRRVRKGSQR